MSGKLEIYASLHAHSTHSDGVYSPRELARIAKEEGYSAMAVTDHDTVTANEELRIECERLGLESIFGCEFSTRSKTTGLAYHITAFHFDKEHPEMKKYLEDLSEKETHQTRELFRRGVEIGYIKGISWEEVIDLVHRAGGICCLAHPTRQLHTVEALVSIGIDGIEVWHNELSTEEKREALALARKFDLYVSGGADHHGLLGGQYARFDDP